MQWREHYYVQIEVFRIMAKLYATLGPACNQTDVLAQMLHYGLDGMRLNLSHTSLKESTQLLSTFRSACRTVGQQADLMIDLQGPEQRIDGIPEPYTVTSGDQLVIQPSVNCRALPAFHVSPGLAAALRTGDHLLIHDGLIRIEIIRNSTPGANTDTAADDGFLAQVLRGGVLENGQSVKIENREIKSPALTAADLMNLDLAAEAGVTSVMQPFVRSASDLEEVRAALSARNLHAHIFAKIETLSGLDHIREILPSADVIVIARGDLGNAVPLWSLPGVQKDIAALCREAGKPFMVVTQMLQSMISSPVPTRAEVSDIFNAVLDGADYLMVTGETAIGQYPVQVIRYLAQTVQEAESYRARVSTQYSSHSEVSP